MRLAVLGAPGAGKGTQAQILSKRYNIPHISTGDLLRENIKNGTAIGQIIKDLIDNGSLVSDEIAFSVLSERLKEDDVKNGYILDGFPRTVNQADLAEKVLGPMRKVIAVEVPDSLIFSRMEGRRICDNCGKTYHMANKRPKHDGICDECKGKLIQRSDDMPKRVLERLRIYHEKTQPIIDFYREKGILLEVDGTINIEDITENIVKALEV